MTTVLVILLAPVVLSLLAAWLILKVAVLIVRIAFAPVVWLSSRPTRQRVELRHYPRR
jgi:hypothetical protein